MAEAGEQQEVFSQSAAEAAADGSSSPEKAARLRRFLGPVEQRDAETVEHWRKASPAAHAQAMIELAEYADRMAAQTGFSKCESEMFPGFPRPISAEAGQAKRAAP